MIIVFSGNGNTQYIANLLSTNLNDGNLVVLHGDLLNNPGKHSLTVKEGEAIIWCFPCYSWGIPPIIARFIDKIHFPGLNNNVHHLVITCGDDIGLAANIWKKAIYKRHWTVGNAYSVIMPNTYVCMKGFDVDSDEIAKKKLEASHDRAKHIASNIQNKAVGDDVTTGKYKWIKSKIVYPLFTKFCMSPKPFRTNNSCINCGKCSNICPLNNILMGNDSKPIWGKNCTLCLKCYNNCPRHAIEYGNTTKHKGQYVCKAN